MGNTGRRLDRTSGVEAWGGGCGFRRRVGRRRWSPRSGRAGVEGNHDSEHDRAHPKRYDDAKPSAAKPSGTQHRSEEADASTLAAIVRHVLVAAIAIIYRRRNCFARVARLVVGCVLPDRLRTVDLAAPFA
jgi:hypothetical protein